MKVNYPSNANDEDITTSEVVRDFPLSTPTSMSAFIQRIRLAEICRELVDTMPSIMLDHQDMEYDLVLELDAKLRNFIKTLPVFFQLDPASLQISQKICQEQPYIAWQRTILHFSVHTRLCRLHRPFYIEASVNPRYSYSHTMCIRSAQAVLDLRRMMESAGVMIGLWPSRFWTIMQHVFLATVILATDVSVSSTVEEVEARKVEVLAACQVLEMSQKESPTLKKAIQKHMQTLKSLLHKQSAGQSGSQGNIAGASTSNSTILKDHEKPSHVDSNSDTIPSSRILSAEMLGHSPENNGIGDCDWDPSWFDFFHFVPDLDPFQWNSLFDNMEFTLNPELWRCLE